MGKAIKPTLLRKYIRIITVTFKIICQREWLLLISSVTFHRRFDTVKRQSQLKSQLILAEEASKRACTFADRIWDWVKKKN